MKILFVTLEQSARENIKVVLNNNFFQNNIDKFYTFGMSDEDLVFKDLTNIKIKSLMGFVDISKNLPYLFSLRNSLNLIEKNNNFTHIFFVDSFDFSKFYLKKYRNNSVKYCQFIGPSVFIWKKNKAKFINRYFDHIFSIFEVERKFYNKEKYSYIGHPILNNIVYDNRNKYPIKSIGIFLGSRYQEIFNNIPIITQLLKNLDTMGNFNFYFFVTKEFEDLIKNDLSMSFGMKQDNEAKALAAELIQKGFNVKQKTHVHHSTLAGFVREQVESGKDVPHDLFGVYVADRTKILTKE